MTLSIRDVHYQPDLFRPLLEEGRVEDGAFLLRLRDEWQDGTLRFDRDGEFLLGAFLGDALVGIGGVSLDPYAPEPGLGRVRHVYVLKRHRGHGIGRELVEAIINEARGSFHTLRLRTRSAGWLYERFGFLPSDAPDETHRLTL